MKKIIFIILIFVASGVQAGNDPRTENYGGIELLFSPSTRASGMGEAGVSHVHAKSFYFNPGSLGLFALENKITASGFPKKAEYIAGITYYNATGSILFQKANSDSRFLFALGGNYSIINIGPFAETSYESPGGTGRFYTLKLKNYNGTFSVGYINRLQSGAGITVKFIRESFFDYSINGTAFDIGFLARYPIVADNSNLYFTPTFGAAISNLGSDIESDYFGMIDYLRPLRPSSTITKLPKRKSVGLSFEFGINSGSEEDESFAVISILPTYELTKLMDHDWYPVYGFEIGLANAFYYRVGKNKGVSIGWTDENSTKGYSFSSSGLFKLLQSDSSTKSTRSGINKFFTDKISIEYSYANSVIMKSYHEILLTFQI